LAHFTVGTYFIVLSWIYWWSMFISGKFSIISICSNLN